MCTQNQCLNWWTWNNQNQLKIFFQIDLNAFSEIIEHRYVLVSAGSHRIPIHLGQVYILVPQTLQRVQNSLDMILHRFSLSFLANWMTLSFDRWSDIGNQSPIWRMDSRKGGAPEATWPSLPLTPPGLFVRPNVRTWALRSPTPWHQHDRRFGLFSKFNPCINGNNRWLSLSSVMYKFSSSVSSRRTHQRPTRRPSTYRTRKRRALSGSTRTSKTAKLTLLTEALGFWKTW